MTTPKLRPAVAPDNRCPARTGLSVGCEAHEDGSCRCCGSANGHATHRCRCGRWFMIHFPYRGESAHARP